MRTQIDSGSTTVADFIAAELTLRAWSDPKVAFDFEQDPDATVRGICSELGVSPELISARDIAIDKSPIGDIPYNDGDYSMGSGIPTYTCGTVYTITADGPWCIFPTMTGPCNCNPTWVNC